MFGMIVTMEPRGGPQKTTVYAAPPLPSGFAVVLTSCCAVAAPTTRSSESEEPRQPCWNYGHCGTRCHGYIMTIYFVIAGQREKLDVKAWRQEHWPSAYTPNNRRDSSFSRWFFVSVSSVPSRSTMR